MPKNNSPNWDRYIEIGLPLCFVWIFVENDKKKSLFWDCYMSICHMIRFHWNIEFFDQIIAVIVLHTHPHSHCISFDGGYRQRRKNSQLLNRKRIFPLSSVILFFSFHLLESFFYFYFCLSLFSNFVAYRLVCWIECVVFRIKAKREGGTSIQLRAFAPIIW